MDSREASHSVRDREQPSQKRESQVVEVLYEGRVYVHALAQALFVR